MRKFPPRDPKEFVFFVERAIAEAGIESRSFVNYLPEDPLTTIQVVRHLPESYEEYLLKYFSSRLRLLHPHGCELAAKRYLLRRAQLRDSA